MLVRKLLDNPGIAGAIPTFSLHYSVFLRRKQSIP